MKKYQLLKKKKVYDIAFIVIAGLILMGLNESNLLEKYLGFALIPILIAYYFGQYVERKTRLLTENKEDVM